MGAEGGLDGERQSDLTRDTLAVVFLFVLIAAST
jgi:hypothetical protein